jgi:polyhydroxyalkanoate synthesis regulator phasin
MRPNSCGPLTTIGEVVRELARVYRAAKRGDLDSSIAARLANILNQMRAAMEAENLEKRIDALEAKSANRIMPFKPKAVA